MRELLSNNSLFVGQLYEDKSLAHSLPELIYFLNINTFIMPLDFIALDSVNIYTLSNFASFLSSENI